MKKLFFIFFFTSICSISYSQDLIMLKNGSKVEAKVVEITSTSIKYYKFDQQDGPIRILEKHEVSEIVYENGESEKFNVSAPAPRQSSQNESLTRPSKPVKDPILGKGFFIEGFFGISEYTTTASDSYYDNVLDEVNYLTYKTRDIGATIGLRIGNKWYFGKREKWRPGFQATWLRLGIHIVNDLPQGLLFGPRTVSLANVGMCNIFKFNEKLGMEANFSVGPTINIDLNNTGLSSGFSFSMESKLRINKFSLGLDYQYSEMDNPNNVSGFNNFARSSQLHTLAITVGRKF